MTMIFNSCDYGTICNVACTNPDFTIDKHNSSGESLEINNQNYMIIAHVSWMIYKYIQLQTSKMDGIMRKVSICFLFLGTVIEFIYIIILK